MASRSRSITIDGRQHWFDVKSGDRATATQLELLATVEQVDLDDLLESNLSQAECLRRLRDALGIDYLVPLDVAEKRQKWRKARASAPICRICSKHGDSTKHHFVNKWMLRELEHYTQRWSNRRDNCIPVCIDCHRDLHDRSNGSRSIAEFLSPEEKDFASRALQELADEHPKLIILLARGDDSVYEARLIKDWFQGLLD
jgi:hypothetical protein